MNTIELTALKNIKIEDYTYDLPEEKIAKFPLADREASRLLIYDRGVVSETFFSQVPALLKSGQTLIFNNTKVIYARLFFQKETGAHIEIFCLEPLVPADYARNFESNYYCEWSCMVGNLKKWRDGAIFCRFKRGQDEVVLKAEKLGQTGGEVHVRFSWNKELSFSEVLEYCGKIPIPPYLNRESEDSDKIRYQTVYSREEGSVAAPTAGLHFTPELLKEIEEKGVQIARVTLHVGLGTFRPVKVDNILEHHMHSEFYQIDEEAAEKINRAKESGHRVICVGTTSCRTIESAADKNGKLHATNGWTEIFIYPGYEFKVLDCLITNFHLPESTLVMLVSALAGREQVLSAYEEAVKEKYRFFSFGDAMFIK